MLSARAVRLGAYLGVLSLMAWGSTLVGAAEQGQDAVMAALQTLQKGVTSYTASGKSTMSRGDRTFEMALKVVAKAPGMYKETTSSDRMGERSTVCDGKTVWMPMGREGGVRSIDRAAVAKALGIEDPATLYMPREPICLARPFLALNAETIKYVGKEKMGDMDVYVFEGLAKWPERGRRDEGAEPFWPKQKLMISATDGLLRSITTFDREGVGSRVVTYTDVKVNPTVEDATFAFKAPAGTSVEGATEATITQMQAAIEAAKKP